MIQHWMYDDSTFCKQTENTFFKIQNLYFSDYFSKCCTYSCMLNVSLLGTQITSSSKHIIPWNLLCSILALRWIRQFARCLSQIIVILPLQKSFFLYFTPRLLENFSLFHTYSQPFAPRNLYFSILSKPTKSLFFNTLYYLSNSFLSQKFI